MNERIKQLADQAMQYAEQLHGRFHEGHEAPNWDTFDAYEQKFAELIHRKVIASILITDVVMEEKGQVPTSEDYIRAIHSDFGV